MVRNEIIIKLDALAEQERKNLKHETVVVDLAYTVCVTKIAIYEDLAKAFREID